MGVERGWMGGGGDGGGGGCRVVSNRQLTWVSIHLGLLLLLLPALLCQTLLFQINKCSTNFSLLNLCRLLHNNEGWCCQSMCPAGNDPPVSGNNEKRMYSHRRRGALQLSTFFSSWTVLALVWMCFCNHSSPVTRHNSPPTYSQQIRDAVQGRRSYGSFYLVPDFSFNRLWYHNTVCLSSRRDR